ncbi:MAG: hypothetical protein HPY53_13940 [Brevinematales bacterium]|nr:hypothetical protein [Brevinematales bacterium]
MKKILILFLLSVIQFAGCSKGYLIRSEGGPDKEVWIGNKKYGPFTDAFSLKFAEHTSDFGFVYQFDNSYYVNINDNIFGPYVDAGYLYFYGFYNDYIYRYKKKDDDGYIRDYFIKTGKQYGPFEEVHDMYAGEWEHSYCIIYQDNEGYGIEINGYSFGEYSEIKYPQFDPSGNYFCFPYREGGNWYIKSAYSSEGPFQSIEQVYWDSNDFKILYNNGYSMYLGE